MIDAEGKKDYDIKTSEERLLSDESTLSTEPSLILEDQVQELLLKLQVQGSTLNDMNDLIGRLRTDLAQEQNEKAELGKRLTRITKNLNDYTDFVRPEFPAFTIAEVTGLTSDEVIEIAENFELFKDHNCAIRVNRINRPNPPKSATTVLFSMRGITLILKGLIEAKSGVKDNDRLSKRVMEKVKALDLDFHGPKDIDFLGINIVFSPSKYIPSKNKLWKLIPILGEDFLKRELPKHAGHLNEETISSMFADSQTIFYFFPEKSLLSSMPPPKGMENRFGVGMPIKAAEALKRFGVDVLEEALEKNTVRI